MLLCFGTRRKKNVDNKPMFIDSAKQCCTEPRPLSVKGLKSCEGTELEQLP